MRFLDSLTILVTVLIGAFVGFLIVAAMLK
jgi:hypothetical protein